jgi:hypothetical protein
MDCWRAELAEIMESAQGRELTTDEVREALATMTPEERLPALVVIRRLMSERPEHGEGSTPHQRSRAALRA